MFWGEQGAMGMGEALWGRTKVSVGWWVESRNCSSKGKGELHGRSAVLGGHLGTLGKLKSDVADLPFTFS